MTATTSARARRPLVALSLAWAFALTAVAITSVDCSVDHRSQEFACTTAADCTAGRICVDGFCVVDGPGSGTKIDAGMPTDAQRIDAALPIDAPACPAICTTCDVLGKTCDIDCGQTDLCVNNGPVACPPGYSCTIECSTNGACRSITCAGAKSCQIDCSGANSCRTLMCGSGECDVTCDGPGSCRGVTCGESCGCEVSCPGDQSCESVICSQILCTGEDGGCEVTNAPQCDSCL